MNAESKMKNPFASVHGDQDLALQGWFDHHPTTGQALPHTPEVDAFVNSSWPMSSHYYTPMNAIWLMQVPDVRLLAKRPYWLVRDGAVPLTWFFYRHPQPPQASTYLFIDEDLIHLVPEAWESHVGSYRVHSEAQPTSETRSAIIGLASESYASLKYVRERAPQISAIEKTSKLFDLYLPTRWSMGQDEDRESYHAQYFREVYRAFPENTRVLTRTELTGTFDLQNVRAWDLNEKLMVADNTLVQNLLKKGAQWPTSKPVQENERYMKMSNFHGYVFNSQPDIKKGQELHNSLKSAQRFHSKTDDVYRTTAFREFPWPNWFGEWIQSSPSLMPEPIEEAPARSKTSAKKKKAMSKKQTSKKKK